LIIVIEGGDQAGKKTQTAMLAQALKKNGIKTATFSFPDYATPVGKEIRRYLDGKRKFSHQVIHCLLAANRWEKLQEIRRAQERSSVLIMNRYCQSNIVYGLVNGMDGPWLENLDRGLPRADLVILLDITRRESFYRKKSGRDRFEKDKEFISRVTSTYRQVAKKRRWKIVDASGTRQEVHDEIMRILGKRAVL